MPLVITSTISAYRLRLRRGPRISLTGRLSNLRGVSIITAIITCYIAIFRINWLVVTIKTLTYPLYTIAIHCMIFHSVEVTSLVILISYKEIYNVLLVRRESTQIVCNFNVGFLFPTFLFESSH